VTNDEWQKDEERERKDTMHLKAHAAQTRRNATNGHGDILPRRGRPTQASARPGGALGEP